MYECVARWEVPLHRMAQTEQFSCDKFIPVRSFKGMGSSNLSDKEMLLWRI